MVPGCLAHLLLLCLVPALGLHSYSLEDEQITREPSLIIAGIGDSGTTAVTVALRDVGMEHCGFRDQFVEPPWGHEGRSRRITDFLKVTNGTFTREAFNRTPRVFSESQSWFKVIANKEYTCILKRRVDQGLKIRVGTKDIKWGFKEPHYAWLLPVMDAAWMNRTRYLLIARDPRDICSNDIQDQFQAYSRYLKTRNCYEWWATFWSNLLESYENEPRFAIVRIEDLVIPDPNWSQESLATMGCMVQHVGMQADFATLKKAVSAMRIAEESATTFQLFGLRGLSEEGSEAEADAMDPQHVNGWQAAGAVRRFHSHVGAYQGHHDNFNATRRAFLVHRVANMTNPTIVHRTMLRLGYDPMGFRLLKPTTKACLCHPA